MNRAASPGGESPARDADANARALLELVDAWRTRECERTLGAARDTAASLLRRARADARAVAHRAFEEARQRRATRIATSTAEVDTRRRVAEQHRLSALLADGMRALPDALASRWHTPSQRGAWIEYVMHEARRRLPPGRWHILHAAGLTDEERERLARSLEVPPAFVQDPAIRAGLCVGAPPNIVDGTLAGLLADAADVQALLLVELAAHADARLALT